MKNEFYLNLLNSLKYPVVVADLEHNIQFMNKPALKEFTEGEKLIGTNLLDCHDEEAQKLILEVLEKLKAGKTEVIISDTPRNRIYLRAVRNEAHELIGYYERYEVPRWR